MNSYQNMYYIQFTNTRNLLRIDSYINVKIKQQRDKVEYEGGTYMYICKHIYSNIHKSSYISYTEFFFHFPGCKTSTGVVIVLFQKTAKKTHCILKVNTHFFNKHVFQMPKWDIIIDMEKPFFFFLDRIYLVI